MMPSERPRGSIASRAHPLQTDPVVQHYHRLACKVAWARRWRCPPGQRAYYRKLLRCGVARDVARREVGV